jgi:hypothetical protein
MKNILKQSILFLGLSSFLFIYGCGVKTVEHTVTVTKVPEKVEPPSLPEYEKIPENIHIGSKKAALIIWQNFLEAERARKEAFNAFTAYDDQRKNLEEDKEDN